MGTPSTRPLRGMGNRIRCGGISFRCDSSSAPMLSQMSFGVPTNESVTLIKPSKDKGAAVYSLLPEFCSIAKNIVAVSKRSMEGLALRDLEDRVKLMRRSICLFYKSVERGVTCKGPKTSVRRVVSTTGGTGVRRFVVSLPSKCSDFMKRQKAHLSNKRGREVSVTEMFLGGPPVLVLSRTADTLSGRDRH